jgi:hypothetical protein
MNVSGYDNWKLSSPNYGEMVSSCCGSDYSDSEDKELDLEIHEECGEYVCDSCGDCCDIIDEEEYAFNRHESYLEDLADDERHGL